MNVLNWLIEWFVRNSDLNKNEISESLNENYLLKGWIDSLKFIMFVTDIETKLNIKFSNDEFQKNEFSTILGLSKIIEAKINERL